MRVTSDLSLLQGGFIPEFTQRRFSNLTILNKEPKGFQCFVAQFATCGDNRTSLSVYSLFSSDPLDSFFLFFVFLKAALSRSTRVKKCPRFKPATQLAILFADWRKSTGVPGAVIAIFANRRDRRIKSPISGMSDIDD